MERRSERRGLTFLGGKLSFNQGRSVVDCLVRNISSAGALVVFPDRTPDPRRPGPAYQASRSVVPDNGRLART